MTTTSIRLPALFLTALAAATCVSLRAQQPEQPKPQPDKEVAEKVDELKDVVADKNCARDAEGVAIIDLLYKKHEGGLVDKDEKMILKALDGVFNKGKVRLHNQTQLYDAAAAALAKHGAEGAKVLKKAYEGKRFPDKTEWVPLREKLLRSVGKTRDESMVKFLLDEARRSPEAALQAAAGDALGNFEGSDEKVRKEIVSQLLVKYGSLSESASQLGNNVEAQNDKERLAALSGPWNDTLKKLTKQNFDTFRDWQEWHNKNKNKDW